MRQLASIQKVTRIEPIDGADRIEIAHVLGWQCVVNKGQFNEGDSAVYFEIDSFLPIRDTFEFLRKSCFKNSDVLGEGFKLRTQTFKGKISQGLLLPINQFPEITSVRIGDDVTDLLGVKKWAVAERATTNGTIIGELPYSIPRTDETRIQSMPELLQEFNDMQYYITTKFDGSSHSIGIDENGFHVTGHNYEYKDGSFYDFIEKHGYKEKVTTFFENCNLKTLTIQGELCAPGIQKNRLKLRSPQWFVFTVIENGKRVDIGRMLTICNTLDLQHVPIEEIGQNLPVVYPTVEDILKRAEGEYPNGGKKEGIVVRPTTPVQSSFLGDYLSFKAINNQFLLKG